MFDYCSPFPTWHRTSAVRSMPDEKWLAGHEGEWMSAEEAVVLSHPDVHPHARSAGASLLLSELRFTVTLESRLISPVALDIAEGALRADYPDVVVTDALRVQCDEAYHAVLACELINEVQSLSGIRARDSEHPFLVHVDQLALTFPAEDAPLVRFCAAVVSETLITSTLLHERLHDELQEDVRNFRHRHYLDELRHSSFFSQMLHIVLPQWPESLRSALRPVWSGLVDAFLVADESVTLAALQDAGFSPARAEEIVAESSSAGRQRTHRSASTKFTLSTLRRAGAISETAQIAGTL